MSIKIRKQRGEAASQARRQRKAGDDDILEVGRGEHCVLTINHHTGATVVQRFETRAEAEAQHQRNVAEDRPLVGFDGFN